MTLVATNGTYPQANVRADNSYIFDGQNIKYYPLGQIQSENHKKLAPIFKLEIPTLDAEDQSNLHKGIQIMGAYKDISISGIMSKEEIQTFNAGNSLADWIKDIENLIHGGSATTAQFYYNTTIDGDAFIQTNGNAIDLGWKVVIEGFDWTYVAGAVTKIDYSLNMWVGETL